MPISQEHHDLFHKSNALDKLTLLQTLLDSKILSSDEALALLNIVHAELARSQEHDPEVYVRYGELMASLQREMPQVYQEVIDKWEILRLTSQKHVTKEYDETPENTENENYVSTKKEHVVSSHKTVPSINIQPPSKSVDEKMEIGGEAEDPLEAPEPEEEETEAKEEKEEAEERDELEEEVETEKEEKAVGEENESEKNEEEEELEEEKEEDSKESEEKEEEAEESEKEEKEESEELETEETEEKEEEQEVEKEEVETEAETENAEETERMVTEGAEAAEHIEEQVNELPEIEEEPDAESEPPEAGE